MKTIMVILTIINGLIPNFNAILETEEKSKKFDETLKWLAVNVYREAGNESFKGMIAVACVTMNRVYSKRYPNSLKKVIFQKAQFSWTLNARIRRASYPSLFKRLSKKKKYVAVIWKKALKASLIAQNRKNCVRYYGIYHYLNPKIANQKIVRRWEKCKRYSFDVNNHRFYRMKKLCK